MDNEPTTVNIDVAYDYAILRSIDDNFDYFNGYGPQTLYKNDPVTLVFKPAGTPINIILTITDSNVTVTSPPTMQGGRFAFNIELYKK